MPEQHIIFDQSDPFRKGERIYYVLRPDGTAIEDMFGTVQYEDVDGAIGYCRMMGLSYMFRHASDPLTKGNAHV